MWTFKEFKSKLQVPGDESLHEQTDSWSNRDLVPLPPNRRTWVIWAFFGYWSLDFMNVSQSVL
jgi:NCS1 family nucleobase:cation symporter-1